jgi:hypothetical protein
MQQSARIRPRPFRSAFVALISALTLVASLGLTVNADTNTKTYTAKWVSGGTLVPPNGLTLSSGTATAVLRLTNTASPQSLGSANVTVPNGYKLNSGTLSPAVGTATKSGNTLQLRNLNLAPSSFVDVSINVTAPCGGSAQVPWALTVKQANNFSGPPGNDFVLQSGEVAPTTSAPASGCLLRFVNQPNTTKTGLTITSGYNSSGDPIQVEIIDPATSARVNTNANVSLVAGKNLLAADLSGGGPVAAVAGLATFPSLSIDLAGLYTVKATSPAASNQPESDTFLVQDTVDTCPGANCTFKQTDPDTGSSFTVTPKNGTKGAQFASTLDLSGVSISCDTERFHYPDSRQPNTIFFIYNDGSANSVKVGKIDINKVIVQATPENGASKYRICYASPDGFTDRSGQAALQDAALTSYFGVPWYSGLLADCSSSNPPATELPCSLGFTGSGSGNRVGTFLAPPGDPFIR